MSRVEDLPARRKRRNGLRFVSQYSELSRKMGPKGLMFMVLLSASSHQQRNIAPLLFTHEHDELVLFVGAHGSELTLCLLCDLRGSTIESVQSVLAEGCRRERKRIMHELAKSVTHAPVFPFFLLPHVPIIFLDY